MSTSTPSVSRQRCFNHSLREAAARCPECRRFFCRECVAEHDDRVLCAPCLKKLAAAPGLAQRRAFSVLRRSIQLVVGILIAWFYFFIIGEGLLRIPASFHDTSVWRVPWVAPE